MSGALNPFDLFVLVVLVLTTFWGGMRGIVSQVTSIFSWLASAYIATHYYTIVAKFMNASYAYYKPLAMIVTFIVSALLIRIASNVIKNMVSLAGLKEFDRQMGAALGLLKGALLCLLVTFVFIVFNGSTRSIVENSNTGPYFAAFISKVQRRLPESELTSRFLAYANAIEEKKSTEDDGTESKSITSEVRELKKYLVSRVLSDAASDIVAEAEESDVAGSEGTINSLFQSATSALNRLKESSEAITDDSTFQSAASSVNRLKNRIKEAVSQGSTDESSSSLSGSYPYDDRRDYDYDYERREYGDYERNGFAPFAEQRSTLDDIPYSDSAPSSSYARGGTTDVPSGLAAPIVQDSVANQTANSESDMTGLEAFFKSIGGGYGSRRRSEQNTDAAFPQNRSGVARPFDANASRSRLNSRNYTIESSSVNY